MVAPTSLLLAMFSIATAASAQMIAIIETNPTYFDSRNCYDGAKSYDIVDFGSSHAPSTGSSCTNRGTVLSSMRGLDTPNVDTSCTDGKWTNGYKVCVVFGVVMVFDGNGRRQGCQAEDVMIFNCPTAQPCWTNKKRKYRCLGTWYSN